jgi:transglutaminase-like putative cysteine protease
MALDALLWTMNRLRPAEGWLSLSLLIAALACMAAAILAVGWAPEADVVGVTAVFGLILAYLLAKRARSPRFAWLLLLLYGVLITTIRLANLTPSLALLRQGFWPLREYWLQNGALFLDRSASWLIAVAGGNRSQETILFAFGLGLGVWLLTAFAVWTVIRLQKPLLGLTLMGAALALNGFFGLSPIWYLVVFVGLAALLSATTNLSTLEQSWRQRGLDYSGEIRLELLIYASAISMMLLMAAMILPAFSITKLVDAFLTHPWVTGVEETLDEAFGGVNKPRTRPPGSPGGYGVMPRSYLLGEEPPVLSEIIMMTATITDPDGNPAPPELTRRSHWRGLSYEVYTGRGWTLSQEREESLPANEAVNLPETAGTLELVQNVQWLRDERLMRYTLGEPLQFDHEVILRWRGLDDLVRVQGQAVAYQVRTRVSVASPEELRQTQTANTPPVILSRYTQLPDSLPQRVRDLAQEVAGDLRNPYDQARALELFLRQYPYSLDVDPAPLGADPVDYFLFDLQSGYCDYYASAMVVLARSLGLPARMAVGFLSQPPDENGVQTIRQSNGHSWAEVYFDGYGWVEFEPTAGFASPHDTALEQDWGYRPPEDFVNLGDTAPLPPRDPAERPIAWQTILTRVGLVGLAAGGLAAAWFWRQRRLEAEDSVAAAYGRLQFQAQKLNHPPLPQQTPAEFNQALQENLTGFPDRFHAQERAAAIKPLAARLADLFAEHQYAANPEDHAGEARSLWQKMKRPFWLLRLSKRLMK